MLKALRGWFDVDDWKRSVALVILWAYAYQLLVWPLWFNATTLLNAVYGWSLPAPVIIPWEQLLAGTTTLAAIGGIAAWRDQAASTTITKETSTTLKTTGDPQ